MSSLPKLETLIKIEATIWMNSKGSFVSLPLEEFYTLARTHEWTGSVVSSGSGNAKEDITYMSTKTKLSKQVEDLLKDFSDEERLLFNLMAACGWKSSELTPKLYPLFQIVTKDDSNRYLLEMLKPPESVSVTMAASSPNSVSPTKAKLQIASVPRSEVLRNMYVQSKTYAALHDDSSQPDSKSWWENASSSAKMILEHRKLNTKKMSTKAEAAESTKKIPASARMINTNNGELDGKKMTLEERVRAKSQLRSKYSSTSTVDKTLSATTLRQSEEKSLLELADALRSYSQRRGGNKSNVARLPMSDFMKDATVAWNAIVRNENIKTAAGAKQLEKSRTIATPITSIDLSRVLFHLRLKISCGAGSDGFDLGDSSHKRQMENYVMELLNRLASKIPNWIHLRDIPSSLSTTAKVVKTKETPTNTAQNAKSRKSMRSAIIVIRNDAVDYAKDVREKLGGRTHQSNSLGKRKSNSNTLPERGNKRSLKEFLGQQNAAADAIVPPSFLKRYDKVLKE